MIQSTVALPTLIDFFPSDNQVPENLSVIETISVPDRNVSIIGNLTIDGTVVQFDIKSDYETILVIERILKGGLLQWIGKELSLQVVQ